MTEGGTVAWAEEKVNEKFADMHKAFQFIDLDKSGTLGALTLTTNSDLVLTTDLDRSGTRVLAAATSSPRLTTAAAAAPSADRTELTRALELWQVPLPPGGVEALISQCDADGDGAVTYNEFVKVPAVTQLPPVKQLPPAPHGHHAFLQGGFAPTFRPALT